MKPILKNQAEFPTVENLAKHLSKENLSLYQQLLTELHENTYMEDWNYYKDGNNWLSKILFKKKNLGWISIWETGVKVNVFFSERVWPLLVANELFAKLEANEASIQKNGKLNTVLIPIQDQASLQTAVELVNFKKKLK